MKRRRPGEQRKERTMPEALEIFRAGGVLMGPLLLTCAAIWYLLARRWLLLRREAHIVPGLATEIADLYRTKGTAACATRLSGERGLLPHILRQLFRPAEGMPTRRRLDELILSARIGLGRPGTLLRVLVKIAPLLGLLGTVLGMVETFAVLKAMGTSDPRALSGGISQALLTTQTGLLIALPGLYGERWFRRREEILERELERTRLALYRILP
jgi:biopolymer transport protein ExbB